MLLACPERPGSSPNSEVVENGALCRTSRNAADAHPAAARVTVRSATYTGRADGGRGARRTTAVGFTAGGYLRSFTSHAMPGYA